MDLPARKRIEANTKRSNLCAELKHWREAALTELPQHHTQVAAAIQLLEGILKNEKVEELELEQYTRLVLAAHRIWEYFRAKWAQRYSTEMRNYLEWADQLAYDCYQPVARLVSKAPPLVFLNGGFSPFVQPRDRPFLAESVATQEGITDKRAQAALQKLPFPVIGVPWYQMAHLPDMVSIGHEVGHVVEDDLEVTATLQEIFGGAVHPSRKAFWCAWQRELFADVWGCLSTGPAYPYGLADFLAPAKPWVEPADATAKYPPAWLRVRFNFDLVAELEPDFGQEMTRAKAIWAQYFPEGPAESLEDLKTLIPAIKNASLPKLGKLAEQDGFDQEKYAKAKRLSQVWLPDGTQPYPVKDPGMRILVAAVRLAYDSSPEAVSSGPVVETIRTAFNGAVDRITLRAESEVADRTQELFRLLVDE